MHLRKVIKITDEYDGEKLRTVKNGAKYWTPMLIVFLTIGTTDVMFAFDSIPAIFGLTKDPFIVFTSNVFALLGLQQLYFLLGELLDKLVVSAAWTFRGAGLHWRQAHHGGIAWQFVAVHQWRSTDRLGAGSAHMAVVGGDRCGDWWCRIGQCAEDACHRSKGKVTI